MFGHTHAKEFRGTNKRDTPALVSPRSPLSQFLSASSLTRYSAVECLDQFIDVRPVVRAVAPEAIDEDTVGIDDEVATELTGVFGRLPKITQSAATKNFEISLRNTEAPYSPERATAEAERPVGRATSVHNYGKVDPMLVAVGRHISRIGEGNDRDIGVAPELVESVAHGTDMCCAGQSIDVSVKDQDQIAAAVIGDHPRSPV